MENKLKDFLDTKVIEYDQLSFINADPISIPHLFHKKQDIEIAGFFAAVFSWGSRTTIINKSKELMKLMNNEPYEFCMNVNAENLKSLLDFKHRTFNTTDLLYFIEFIKYHFERYESLEDAFSRWMNNDDENIENALTGFNKYFFSIDDFPKRTKKHIATPAKKSNCKRLNMFLRWMVRKDNAGVDFGIWEKIKPSQLICPIDLHVAKVARRFNLLHRKQIDWIAAIELTGYLKTLDADDPAKYDFALFGLGVIEKYY